MARIIKIDTDGSVTEIESRVEYPHLNKIFGEDRLIEIVRTQRLQDPFSEPFPVMIVDEDGIAAELPLNEAATALYVPYVYRDKYRIVGPALIVGTEQGPEGEDFTGLRDEVTVEKIQSLIKMFEDH